ncbi:hypothetical protein CY35_09G028000 [Sphagnum magellanicum]|nr:hypothetical protein CY35_09G028000 [Sphagnum magellanicum]
MDYSLGAVKVLIAQLQAAQEVPRTGGVTMSLGSLLFQRAWLQGIIVESPDQESLWLDDGSGVLKLVFVKDLKMPSWKPGMYVLVIGAYLFASTGVPFLKVHKIVDLSFYSNREALWHLEVIEAHQLFYRHSINGHFYDATIDDGLS